MSVIRGHLGEPNSHWLPLVGNEGIGALYIHFTPSFPAKNQPGLGPCTPRRLGFRV